MSENEASFILYEAKKVDDALGGQRRFLTNYKIKFCHSQPASGMANKSIRKGKEIFLFYFRQTTKKISRR